MRDTASAGIVDENLRTRRQTLGHRLPKSPIAGGPRKEDHASLSVRHVDGLGASAPTGESPRRGSCTNQGLAKSRRQQIINHSTQKNPRTIGSHRVTMIRAAASGTGEAKHALGVPVEEQGLRLVVQFQRLESLEAVPRGPGRMVRAEED